MDRYWNISINIKYLEILSKCFEVLNVESGMYMIQYNSKLSLIHQTCVRSPNFMLKFIFFAKFKVITSQELTNIRYQY